MTSLKRTFALSVGLLGILMAVGTHGTPHLKLGESKKLLRNYDKSKPKDSVNVRIGLYINSLYSVSEQNMDYSVSMYFRQSWQDTRLKFEPQEGINKITVPHSEIGKIWKPDTFFRNEKSAFNHALTAPNGLLRVNNTGHVFYVTKMTATLSCPMDLTKYPFDTQKCPFFFESFKYSADTIVYKWLQTPVDVDKSVRLPSFTLKDVHLNNCSMTYTAGSFSCLGIDFVLKRNVGFYILQIYLPAILITCLSWLSFWVSVEQAAVRAAIGLTTLLTSVLLSALSRFQLPKVSYATALDVWNSTCLLFIAFAFLEFILVQFLARRRSEKGAECGEVNKQTAEVKDRGDKICRLAFPLAFLVFLIVYFTIYAS